MSNESGRPETKETQNAINRNANKVHTLVESLHILRHQTDTNAVLGGVNHRLVSLEGDSRLK